LQKTENVLLQTNFNSKGSFKENQVVKQFKSVKNLHTLTDMDWILFSRDFCCT